MRGYGQLRRFDLIRWTGVILLLAMGAIHLSELEYAFDQHWTLGLAFAGNAFLASLAALGIGCDVRNLGWRLGFMLSGASLGVFLIAQTLGLPGVGVRWWLEPIVLYACTVEAMFLILVSIIVRMPFWQTAVSQRQPM